MIRCNYLMKFLKLKIDKIFSKELPNVKTIYLENNLKEAKINVLRRGVALSPVSAGY